MKKYDMKKIMNDAWHMMRANDVGGIYQITFSEALRSAWAIAKKSLRKAECASEIIRSGKYDYIAKEKSLMKRDDLVRKAFNSLRVEGEKVRTVFKKGLMSKAEFDEYTFIKNPAEHSVLVAFKNTCTKKSNRPIWNDFSWIVALGPLPEEEF